MPPNPSSPSAVSLASDLGSPLPRSDAYLSSGATLIIQSASRQVVALLNAVQAVVALDGAFRVRFGDGGPSRIVTSVLIPANCACAVESDAPVAIIVISPIAVTATDFALSCSDPRV